MESQKPKEVTLDEALAKAEANQPVYLIKNPMKIRQEPTADLGSHVESEAIQKAKKKKRKVAKKSRKKNRRK